jgi:PAS domain S-box-containing protein
MKKNIIKSKADILRQKAVDLFFQNIKKISFQLDKADTQKLIQELEIHKLELEMQNEELSQTEFTTKKTAEKYIDLYDFAPSSYFTLTNTGKIIDLNLSAATMLDKVRDKLINSQFSFFLTDDTKPIFNQFLDNTFNLRTKQTCEVTLNLETGFQISINLFGIIDKSDNHCLLTAIDLAEQAQSKNFNRTLLSSLPYPAMYVRRKDKVILAANKIAINYGAKIGGHCWREFGKTEYISEKDKKIAQKFPHLVPEEFNIKCTFCLGDECISGSPCQNDTEIKAFDRIWDTYWIKVSDDIFLHYLVDITERKQLEDSLRESEQFLKQTQQIAMLGTYSLDILSGNWDSSEVMDTIFGIDAAFEKTIETWISIIHPDWQKTMNGYFKNDIIGKRLHFNKEYKIIRQNDKAERWVHGLGDLILDDKNQPIKMIGTIRDITERKKAEEERKYLLAAVENITDRVVVKDLDLKVVAANKSWINSRGKMTLEDVIGKTDADVFGVPADSEPISTYMDEERRAQKLAQGEYILSEFPVKLSTGEETIALSKTFPIFDESGNLFCTGTLATDITERKKMEEALRESEMFLKQTQQIATLGTYNLNISTGHWQSSEVLDSILGIDANYDKTYDSWLAIIHPDWQKMITDYFANDVIKARSGFNKEYKIIRQNDKEERWVQCLGDIKLDDNNLVTNMIGTIRDVTERKEKEEERKLLFTAVENNDNRIVVKDLNLKVIAANKAWILSRGETSIKNLLGKTDAEVLGVSPDSEPVHTFMEEDKKAQKLAPGEFIKSELPMKLLDGVNRIALVKKFPIFNEKGEVFCTGSVSTDITELKKMEVVLRESEMFLKQTQQIAMLGTFTLDISSGHWESSEVLDSIFGIDNKYNRTFESWIKIVHPESRKALNDFFRLEVIGIKTKFDKEYKIIRQSDKAERWVHGIGSLEFNDKNEPVKMIGTIRDITERKEEQARIIRNLKFTEALLKSIPIPVFSLDANGLYTGCNEAFTDQLGLTAEEIKGKSAMDLWPGEQSKINFQSDLDLIANPEFKTFETKVIDKNNQARDVILVKNVFCDEIGKVAGVVGTYFDITERKLTENALRKSEQMLLTILEHFPGVVFWKDRQSTYLGCNKAFAIGAGLNSPSEIIGKTDFDLPWSETEAASYLNDDFLVMENRKTKIHIVETQHQADGKVIWFDTSKIPLREPSGEVIGVIGVSNDITDRKLAEDALKESEEKYRTIANFTDDWEYWLDPNENFVYCSPSCERITGYNATEFIQKPTLLALIIHPDDLRIYLKHKKEQLFRASDTELQFRIIRADGQVIWIGHVCQPVFNDSGDFIGIRGSNRDITDRKKTEEKLKNSEQKYKLISLNITDGIFISKDGYFDYVNPSMSHIFGYDESEMVGLNLVELIIPERRVDFEAYISVDPTTDQVNNIEIECLRKDNSIVFVEIFLNYVASEMLTYGIMHDITMKKRLQEKNIVKAIIQTEEKERANFSKELHDGLGPLLSTIKLYLQWSLRPKSNKSRNEIISKAEEILEEALTTVKEISNKLSPHLLTNYGLTSAIQNFINKLEETHTFKIDFQSNLTRRIELEIEVALYRATIECINNTIKYAKAKQIHIQVIDMGNQVHLQYMDDGKGFDIIKILSEKKGLGLYNLQNRIQTIGGEIKMFSNIHEGVNYHINVPIK